MTPRAKLFIQKGFENEDELEGEIRAFSYEWFLTQWFLVLTQRQEGTW